MYVYSDFLLAIDELFTVKFSTQPEANNSYKL